MPHADHDAILDAFRRKGAQVHHCARGGADGYTHVHGPSQQVGIDRCTAHSICVETQNGTVAVRAPVGEMLGGTKRPNQPIADHPLGFSHRPDYGQFGYAFDMQTIRTRWQGLDAFADAVVAAVQKDGGGW